MDTFLAVDVPDRRLWFDIFYLLAFLLAFGMLLYQGNKKRYPSLAWLLMLALSWLLFVIGCKLPTYSAEEWAGVLQGALPPTTRMMVLGGILLGTVGMLLGRWWGRLPLSSLDLFAWVMPLCMLVQRLGCFLMGCCYGSPSTLPWAVRYPVGTPVHAHQYAAGLVGPGDEWSQAVHPSQLYELIAAFAVFGLVLLSRPYWRAAGNSFLSSMLYYGSLRFFLDFFRAGQTFEGAGAGEWGLSKLQLGIALLMPLLLVIMLMREKRKRPTEVVRAEPSAPALGWHLFLILIMVGTFWSLRNWLAMREILVLNIAFVPLLLAAGVKCFEAVTVPAYRWLTASVLVLPLFLMSQTLPAPVSDSTYLKTYTTIGFGYGTGDYENYLSIGQGEGCDRVSNTEYYRQEYTVVGGRLALTREQEFDKYTYGINVYGGRHTETSLSSGTKEVTGLWGINPFFKYDRRVFGVGGGLHLGNLVYTLEDKDEDGNGIPQSGSQRLPVYPQLYLQLGPRDIIFGRFTLADHFPSAMPGLRYQLSLGTGLGSKSGLELQVGTNTLYPFVSAYVPIKDRLVLESLYLWGDSNTPNLYKQRQFSLGLHYRFGHKIRGKKVDERLQNQ